MREWTAALASCVVMLLLEILTFSTLLGGDIISRTFQFLFYGPFLGAQNLLRFARDSWGAPLPTTLFGGFPGWLNGLLLVMNWAIYSLLGFIAWRLMDARARGRK
ncbi:hypothetical protein [Cystobacter ferrugineus]|uniref:Uncharacterized protein n=1 Tax=Cystobacter ferrugineus TaxID=83449 RepID=A0A1L9B7X6_9BACT|nr:hypothetical protein [Cystobacter ferrugineus]OJH38360.1 hypothetical protein BON30_24825 [Cystobacter ferrugineus]